MDIHRPGLGDNDQVHVLHWDGTEDYLLPEHNRTGKSRSILEMQLDGSNVANHFLASIRQRYVFLVQFIQLQLDLNLWRNAKENSTGIRQGVNLDWLQLRLAGVLQ